MHTLQPRLMMIGQKPIKVTLKGDEVVEGHVNYRDNEGFELLIGQDLRWIRFTDLKRNI
jgi:hypothetical protein